jgi:hypothetical protein
MNTLPLAEIDPVQIIIIVIALVGGFIQWLWSLLKQSNAETTPRNPDVPDQVEKKLREEAWRRQVQGSPTPAPAPPAQDPFSTVKEIFEQIKKDAEAARRMTPTAQPPPLPSKQKVPKYRQPSQPPALPKEPEKSVSVVPTTATTPPASQPEVIKFSSAKAPEWAGLLSSPAALRQAFIFREILGPPKALQSSGDSAL